MSPNDKKKESMMVVNSFKPLSKKLDLLSDDFNTWNVELGVKLNKYIE
jgi:hypothetical protein